MGQTVVIHLVDENIIIGDVDQLPDPADQFMILQDPKQRDGSRLASIRPEVNTILLPWHQIAYVQLIPESGSERVIGFVRE